MNVICHRYWQFHILYQRGADRFVEITQGFVEINTQRFPSLMCAKDVLRCTSRHMGLQWRQQCNHPLHYSDIGGEWTMTQCNSLSVVWHDVRRQKNGRCTRQPHYNTTMTLFCQNCFKIWHKITWHDYGTYNTSWQHISRVKQRDDDAKGWHWHQPHNNSASD